ncbi:DUF4411 family protein [uncultured Methanobrevibacter sp.]|uniref:DUF4411 family protein n=1 Tax=uncultured Methanobrevibacter sp. TaxID=253161 RepID=UPI0025D1BB50|nr:DUF4411 family protein [uncultured Methanobrevibacter sp.]
METYVFDTDVIINLNKFNPRVFKSLWNNLYNMIDNKIIFSVPEVQREISEIDDSVKEKWNEIHNNNGFFVDLSEKDNSLEYWRAMEELESFEIFQKHGENKKYWADPYLIAVGIVDGSIVVTNETYKSHPQRKIPFVCEQMNVECFNFDEFMIHQGWKW